MPSIPKTSNMRYLILFFAIGASLQACTEEETDDLRNKWKLIEVLADPGDGSGTFQPVESDKTISFLRMRLLFRMANCALWALLPTMVLQERIPKQK